ncbi:flavodoxin domain-containing protein [Brockia lithotrophica]|uniref:Flavodoxin n=1 Tax=Brockia lithotrophica TaxID=933949 RepID=A0A660L4S6_9BACL|nr:flavodoxin domain-containing protein [Brockia lithotrophica]RKQ89041.1 flavodoxin [Brockia lithotrophica]
MKAEPGSSAPPKVLVAYVSYSGNTRETAEIIAGVLAEKGMEVALLDVSEVGIPSEDEAPSDPQDVREFKGNSGTRGTGVPLEGYDVYVFGALTWGDGELPEEMRVFLRGLLPLLERRFEEGRAGTSAVFGTGDSIFPRFCWAVDIIFHHLTKRGIPTFPEKLKIEQSPYGLGQVAKVKAWAERFAEWMQGSTTVEDAAQEASTSKFVVK